MPIKVKCIKNTSRVPHLRAFKEGREYLASLEGGEPQGLPYAVWYIQPKEGNDCNPVRCPVPTFDVYFEEVEERNHKYVEGMTDDEVAQAIAARQKARGLLRAKAREFLARFR